MKRIALLLLCVLLAGCAVKTSAPSAEAETVTLSIASGAPSAPPAAPTAPAAPRQDTPANIPADAPTDPAQADSPHPAEPPASGLVPKELFPTVKAESGAAYGADLVCFADGIGLCYDFDGWGAEGASVWVEEAPAEDLPPTETHRLLLSLGGETFCLGELRYDTSDLSHRNFFGKPYDWVVMDSDLADARPAALRPPRGFSEQSIGFLTGFDATRHTVDVLTARQIPSDDDFLYEIDPDSIADAPITLTVPEDAFLTVSDEYPMMPVTRERFFKLLSDGYVGFLPAEGEDVFIGVFLGYANGAVTYLCESYLP